MRAHIKTLTKTILLALASVSLVGCGGRQFIPEQDTGYEAPEKKSGLDLMEVGILAGAGVGAAGGILFPPAALSGMAGAAALGAGMGVAGGGLVAGTCRVSPGICYGHKPYDGILMSGNVLRGEMRGDNLIWQGELTPDSHDYEYRVFKYPKGKNQAIFPSNSLEALWSSEVLFDNEKLSVEGGDLVDVYFPHMPDLERKAITDGLIYNGTIIHIVCKDGDDECFDKFAPDEDNFILGRWKTLDEFKADYAETGGFPLTEERHAAQ